MSEDTDFETAQRGYQAEQELAFTKAAFDKVRTAALEELVRTGAGQEAKRERLIVLCQILDAVRGAVTEVANSGAIAREALAQRDLLRP